MSKLIFMLVVGWICGVSASNSDTVDMIIRQQHYEHLEPTNITTCGYDACFRVLSNDLTQKCVSTEECCEKFNSHCLYKFRIHDIHRVSMMAAEYPWERYAWGKDPAFQRKCVDSPSCVQGFIDEYRNVKLPEILVKKRLNAEANKRLKVETKKRLEMEANRPHPIFIIVIVLMLAYIYLIAR